jgi:hypothetical protein
MRLDLQRMVFLPSDASIDLSDLSLPTSAERARSKNSEAISLKFFDRRCISVFRSLGINATNGRIGSTTKRSMRAKVARMLPRAANVEAT